MTQDASPQLHLVTDNHVERLVDDPRTDAVAPDGGVMAGLLRRAEALDALGAPAPTGHRSRPLLLVTVGAGLTVVLALLGDQAWPLPQRGPSGGTGIPQSLLTFLLLGAGLCVWLAGRMVRPAATLRSAGAAHLWWVVVAGAAVVSVAADLSLASFAGTGERPTDLLARCAVPLVPAVLAGYLAADAGRTARIRAALGTGLVTVPLAALGWALLASPVRSSAGLADVLSMTSLAAVAPLALGVAFVAADRRSRHPA